MKRAALLLALGLLAMGCGDETVGGEDVVAAGRDVVAPDQGEGPTDAWEGRDAPGRDVPPPKDLHLPHDTVGDRGQDDLPQRDAPQPGVDGSLEDRAADRPRIDVPFEDRGGALRDIPGLPDEGGGDEDRALRDIPGLPDEGGEDGGDGPSLCCSEDEQCGPGQLCRQGFCVAAPGPGLCYTAQDCREGPPDCEAMDCPCGSPECGPPPQGRCHCEDYCFVDFPCAVIYGHAEPPFCDPYYGLIVGLREVSCEEACGVSSSYCCSGGGCDVDSVDCEGGCQPLAEGGEGCVDCCSSDADCPSGTDCVCAMAGGCDGTCRALPPPGQCWTDEDCPEGQACEGAVLCPCSSEFCLVTPSMGLCSG